MNRILRPVREISASNVIFSLVHGAAETSYGIYCDESGKCQTMDNLGNLTQLVKLDKMRPQHKSLMATFLDILDTLV